MWALLDFSDISLYYKNTIFRGVFMKKLLCILLTLMIIFSATGCSYSVPEPMQYPDYTFAAEPDTMQLRMMAVQAMRDILCIQWHTKEEIRYRKNGPVNNKEFLHEPGKTYAGLLYSTANTGIFQFFEYYNTKTGCLEYDGTTEELKLELGSSCADALLWGWSTVCNSITGGFYPVMMVPNNGYLAVGDYTYRQTINSYYEMPSNAIISINPKEVILDAYAKTLPADALVSTTDNHAMMVIEAPVVAFLPDGSIDSENSYLMIQDQRAGGSTSFKEVVDGVEIPYSGRISAKYTFDTLLEKNYIPVTAAEFTGAKAYDKASVTVSDPDCSNMETLMNVTVEANYPLAVINIISRNENGKETVIGKTVFGGGSMHGAPRNYTLSEMEVLEQLTLESGCTIKLEVVVSTGERFYPIEFIV